MNMSPLKISPAYWADCLEDERQLGPLMGWARIKMPTQPLPNAWLFGSNYAEFTSIVGPQITHNDGVPLPRWRRDAHALGGLIERVPANVLWDKDRVTVWIGWKDGQPAQSADLTATFFQLFADHPTNGHALRKALVQLAIAYLGARRAPNPV